MNGLPDILFFPTSAARTRCADMRRIALSKPIAKPLRSRCIHDWALPAGLVGGESSGARKKSKPLSCCAPGRGETGGRFPLAAVARTLVRMQVIHTIAEFRTVRAKLGTVAFVPTMGALHAGHRALIERAAQLAEHVVVSIFVNPTQFGPREDFNKYPRPLADDLEMCRQAGVSLVFAPSAEEMYPPREEESPQRRGASPAVAADATPLSTPEIVIDVPHLTGVLEGRHRPGHFRGVLQVVAKLFNIVQPQYAVFGQKDYQQLRVIEAMVKALDFPIKIVPVETVREEDGLAMSSRNQYLSPEERQRALAINQGLAEARDELAAGVKQTNRLVTTVQKRLLEQHMNVDYVAAVDPKTFKPVEVVDRPVLLAVAARVGTTRLIDNILLYPPEGSPAPKAAAAPVRRGLGRLCMLLAAMLMLVGCTTTGRFTVGVVNETTDPLSVGLVKDGPPPERSWASPMQISINAPALSTNRWGTLVPPGESAVIGPQTGRFDRGVTAYLRVYRGNWSVQELLAIGPDSPNRLDVPLDNGESRWIIRDSPEGLVVSPAEKAPETGTR